MDFGVYWDTRKVDFPTRQMHPAIPDGGTIFQMGGAMPMRSWLLSEDESIVLQLQHDRFVLNWRRRHDEYPGFAGSGSQLGIRALALAEYEKFAKWIEDRTSEAVDLRRIELTKINVLSKGDQYQDTRELGGILSVARVFADIQTTDPQLLHLRLLENNNGSATNLQIAVGADGVRIETQHVVPVDGEAGTAFESANERLNEVFFGLFKEGLAAFGGIK